MTQSHFIEPVSPPVAYVDFPFARVLIYFDLFPKFDVAPLTSKNPYIFKEKSSHPHVKQLIRLLEIYRDDPKIFSSSKALSYLSHVTDFQKKVFSALCCIPYGETLTYLEMAKQLHSAPRAIGQACKRNPLPFIIPCHRILAKNHLGGYAGACDGFFMTVKSELLKHEGIEINGCKRS